jgi:hypothetical protein
LEKIPSNPETRHGNNAELELQIACLCVWSGKLHSQLGKIPSIASSDKGNKVEKGTAERIHPPDGNILVSVDEVRHHDR